jgi:hypothetical protein
MNGVVVAAVAGEGSSPPSFLLLYMLVCRFPWPRVLRAQQHLARRPPTPHHLWALIVGSSPLSPLVRPLPFPVNSSRPFFSRVIEHDFFLVHFSCCCFFRSFGPWYSNDSCSACLRSNSSDTQLKSFDFFVVQVVKSMSASCYL